MSFSGMLSQTITVLKTGDPIWESDDEGNVIASEAIEELSYPGLIQQREAKEVRVGPDTFTTDAVLFLEADAEVNGRDRVVEGGRVFEVVGDPDVLRTPAGAHHIEVNLRMVTVEATSGS